MWWTRRRRGRWGRGGRDHEGAAVQRELAEMARQWEADVALLSGGGKLTQQPDRSGYHASARAHAVSRVGIRGPGHVVLVMHSSGHAN